MSKTPLVFFMILLVIAGCFIAGCSSLPFSGTPPAGTPKNETPKKIDVGLTGHDIPRVSGKYSFEDTVVDLAATDFDSENGAMLNESSEIHIRYIRGSDLDENGNAERWVFIIDHRNQTSMVSYNRQGMNVLSSPGTIKRADIFTDQILSPRDLIARNHAEIFGSSPAGTPAIQELTLDGGSYTLTISSTGKPRVITFDAKTGVLISSND
jgi:hypothetical protein